LWTRDYKFTDTLPNLVREPVVQMWHKKSRVLSPLQYEFGCTHLKKSLILCYYLKVCFQTIGIIIYMIILISLFIPHMVCELDALFCSLFGSLVLGYCGMREIIYYSRTNKVSYTSFYIKSCYIHFGGWRQLMLNLV